MKILVGKNAGFCYGVKRAVDGTKEILRQEKNFVFCLGELVHNPIVMKKLKEQGLEVVEDIQKVSHKAIIRAHGASRETYEYASKHQIELVDFTCPNVQKIHEIVSEYVEKGFFVFLFGDSKHPETMATKSFCNNRYRVIEKIEDISEAMLTIQKQNERKLLVVSQTTYSAEAFEKGIQMMQNLLPKEMELVIKNTICPATSIRQEEVSELSQRVDLMIIIGGRNSSNTQKLFEIAKANCTKTICIETVQEIEQTFFDEVNVVGVMAGASTSQDSIDEVVNYLKHLK